MYRALLNRKHIAEFNSSEEIISWSESFLKNETEYTYDDDIDKFEIEIDECGFIQLDLCDLNEEGELIIN